MEKFFGTAYPLIWTMVALKVSSLHHTIRMHLIQITKSQGSKKFPICLVLSNLLSRPLLWTTQLCGRRSQNNDFLSSFDLWNCNSIQRTYDYVRFWARFPFKHDCMGFLHSELDSTLTLGKTTYLPFLFRKSLFLPYTKCPLKSMHQMAYF